MKKVTKAIFPVAGLGTRFLPATKAIPKEMLPIVDKPLIQYAVEEAISAGISELIFITGRTKSAITDHFDKANELEAELEKKDKLEKLNIIRNIIPQGITCVYIRQSEPLGLGHAILCAKSVIEDDPFAIILPDDLINDGSRGVTKQLVDLYEEKQKSIIAIENIPRSDTKKYGIVEISDKKIASPLEIAVNILYSVYSLHPNEFEFLSNNFIDRLYGSDKLRNYILSDVDIELLFEEWKNNEEEFMKTKNKYLLYY